MGGGVYVRPIYEPVESSIRVQDMEMWAPSLVEVAGEGGQESRCRPARLTWLLTGIVA